MKTYGKGRVTGTVVLTVFAAVALLGANTPRKMVPTKIVPTTSSTTNVTARLTSLENRVASLEQENSRLKSVIKVSSNGSTVTVEAPTKLYLKAPQIDVRSQTNLKMRSDGSAELRSNANLTLRSNAAAELRSSNITTVKGSIVRIN